MASNVRASSILQPGSVADTPRSIPVAPLEPGHQVTGLGWRASAARDLPHPAPGTPSPDVARHPSPGTRHPIPAARSWWLGSGVAVSLTVLISVGSVLAARPQTPACDELNGRKHRVAQQLLASEHLYDCCDGTIARCLEEQPTCTLALRLADNVCRRVAVGQDEVRIRRALSRRARSMVGGGAAAEIDRSRAPVAGDPRAPVEVVVYACARCPYCSRLLPTLHDAVTAGPLQGQARIVFRSFPIRGHVGSTEAGLAFIAAAEMGSFWEYSLHAYRNFDDFSPERLGQWAAAIGLDPALLAERMADPATRELLVASKKEGLANGVEETPTLFINGRRWVGDLELDELSDAIGEEAERVRGEKWVPR